MKMNWEKLNRRRKLLKSLAYNRKKFGPVIRALSKFTKRIRRKYTWR